MIGEATDDLGKAATAEEGGKQANEAQPGEELEKLEQENEERIEALRGKFIKFVLRFSDSCLCRRRYDL